MSSLSPESPIPSAKNKDYFRKIIDALPAMVYYLDKDYQYNYANSKYTQWLGVQHDALMGKNLNEGLENDTYISIKKFADQALGGESVHFETDICLAHHKDPVSVEATLIPDWDEEGRVRGYLAHLQDVTEKKNLVKKLSQQNKELQDFVDHAPIGLHWVDGNGIILWANKAELDMLGYSAEQYIGHPISEFHVDQQKIGLILSRLAKNETLNQYESELRCQDGSTRAVRISSNVLWEDGKFVHTRCFTMDNTGQKELFEALRQSEEKFRQLIQKLPVAIYTCDPEGRLSMFNNAALQLWGRTPEIGKDVWSGSWKIFKQDGNSVPLEQSPMAVAIKEKKVLKGEEIIVQKPDGEKRYVLAYPEPLLDYSGNLIGGLNTLIDITDLKHADQASKNSERKYRELAGLLEKKIEERTKDLEEKNEELRKSEDRYHKMIDEVEDYAILLLNKDGIVQNWNRGAEKIKGYKDYEIIGKSFKLFYLQEDRQNGLPEKLIQKAASTGKAMQEGWRVRKNGTTFWGSVLITALHNKEGDVIGFTKVTRDLTERKLSEEKMSRYAQELEFQNKELEQFAYAASHDMKEPLRKIIFYNSFINDSVAIQLSEKERLFLSRSIAAASRLQLLIDDLLSYSKTTLQIGNFEPVDLDKVLDEVISENYETVDDKSIILQRDKLPVVTAINFQMKQLFGNLVGNAIKYHHPERRPLVRITHEIVSGTELKEMEAHPFLNYHKISIIDNGIGFNPEQSEKIFEIFQRLNEKTDTSGTGIGLAICRKIAQNHQGFIEATGKLNEGAHFFIYLPSDNL